MNGGLTTRYTKNGLKPSMQRDAFYERKKGFLTNRTRCIQIVFRLTHVIPCPSSRYFWQEKPPDSQQGNHAVTKYPLELHMSRKIN
jgi:hypothetical protein